ncbi:MAG: metallophosphoesterase [Deltaproteobacteria bacterium]|jgi:predicted phosphodiesterase|nr:metallophosphoesterase [Deltaproteobacteria bacterium]MBW2499383.1 metallophosphoesterase [Deltaproteobacteria bacterium]
MRRLFAISDLHVSYRDNLAAISELPEQPEDWLILCGDIAERPEQLELALRVLGPKFERLIWVPGNHELWSLPRDSPLRGVERYERLVELCRRYEVLTPEDPFPVWEGEGGRHLLAPLFTLYDYSFRPDQVPVEESIKWARESGVLCTDELLLHPDPYESRSEWCRARCRESEERLEKALARHDLPTILIAHFPLKQELALLPRIPRFMVWCGTRETEDWHLRFGARVVVSGHLHIPTTRHIDGVRFEEVSLGYPPQWRLRKEHRGWELGDHLRQILPTPAEDAGDPIGALLGRSPA